MNRLVRITALAASVLAPGTVSAVGFGVGIRPTFQTTVTPLDGGIYEVAAKGSSAAITYWCGIGDFAIRTLRIKGNQRIYVWRAYEPGVRTVQFSLTPPPGADTTPGYSITVNRVGANMSALSAQAECYDDVIDFDF